VAEKAAEGAAVQDAIAHLRPGLNDKRKLASKFSFVQTAPTLV
jgi:hypothetical protein